MPLPTDPTYTTVADFEAYVPGWVTDDVAELKKLLMRAERDIDALLGNRPTIEATGLKYAPASLDDWQKAALSRAVCGQAEFLFALGPQAQVLPAGKRVKGPDFETEHDTAAAANARYGRRAIHELSALRGHLFATGARARP